MSGTLVNILYMELFSPAREVVHIDEVCPLLPVKKFAEAKGIRLYILAGHKHFDEESDKINEKNALILRLIEGDFFV